MNQATDLSSSGLGTRPRNEWEAQEQERRNQRQLERLYAVCMRDRGWQSNTEGVGYDNEEWIKAIVLLTDGENNVSGGSNGHNESAYTAFGFAQSGHLGSTNGREAEETLDEKTAKVCASIKNNNVLLYTIGFKVDDKGTQKLLRNCATEPDMYYNSPSNEQLAGIFQDIAQGLGKLRIAQ